MTDIIEVWQCIGCGRIEAPQPCVGVCQDRRARLVRAEDHERALEAARQGEKALALLRTLVRTTPRGAEGLALSYRMFQQRAGAILAETPAGI
jgi:hypothetical protein